jgi:hypothetical protein
VSRLLGFVARHQYKRWGVLPSPPDPFDRRPEQETATPHPGGAPVRQLRREVGWFAGIAVAALVLLLLILVGLPLRFMWALGAFDPPEVQPLPFESAAWKRADPIQRYRTVRSQMVDDILRRRLLDGLSRGEVEQLLGPPIEDLSGFKNHFRRYHLAYYLGLQRHGGALAFYDEFLAIHLDEQGRVAEYRDVRN